MSFAQRSAIALLMLSLGCSAQTKAPTELDRRIDQHLHSYFKLSEEVKIEVGARTASEFPDYDTLVVTLISAGGRTQQVNLLISKDNRTLARMTKMDLTKDPYAEVMNKIDVGHRPWRGSETAKVVVVNYDDFQCPYCAQMHEMLLHELFPAYADRIKIIYKDYPLNEIHPWANRAAVDSGCLAAQSNDSYWAFADGMHANRRDIGGEGKPLAQQTAAVDLAAIQQGQKYHLDMDKLGACIKAQDDSAVKASAAEAERLGVEATPTVFINGHKVNGAVPVGELRAAIERALRDASPPAPAANPAK